MQVEFTVTITSILRLRIFLIILKGGIKSPLSRREIDLSILFLIIFLIKKKCIKRS